MPGPNSGAQESRVPTERGSIDPLKIGHHSPICDRCVRPREPRKTENQAADGPRMRFKVQSCSKCYLGVRSEAGISIYSAVKNVRCDDLTEAFFASQNRSRSYEPATEDNWYANRQREKCILMNILTKSSS